MGALPDGSDALDQLELELRLLPGVGFVGFVRDEVATVVQIGNPSAPVDEEVRTEAARLVSCSIDGPVVVEWLGDAETAEELEPGEQRVRMLVALPVRDNSAVEVHLARGERRAMVEAASPDRFDVAVAVLGALRELGLAVPFQPVAVQPLSGELGAGVLAVLSNPASGELRRGIASGVSEAESTARAVMSALNRYLQPRPTSRA
jgi:hypothetical protein